MADWGLQGGGNGLVVYGTSTSNSQGTTITAGTSSNWSTPTEFSAATAQELHGLWVNVADISVASYTVKVCVGSAGSEVTVIDRLQISMSTARRQQRGVYFPVLIPAGSRLSVAATSGSGSAQTGIVSLVGVYGSPRTPVGLSRVTNYGSSTNSSVAVSVTGGAANTKGASYTQITASTTNPIKHLIILPTTVAGASTIHYLLDVAVGASSSEQHILSDVPWYRHTSLGDVGPDYYSVPVDIPAGTRLSMRMQDSVGSSSASFAFYGLD